MPDDKDVSIHFVTEGQVWYKHDQAHPRCWAGDHFPRVGGKPDTKMTSKVFEASSAMQLLDV